MGMGDVMRTFMGEDKKPMPKLYLDSDQLSELGDVGPIGSEREIHCTVKVATLSKTDDGMTATLEVTEIAFMEDGEEEEEANAVTDRMYPTMKG
jgi:hypothetical protein|tara:strand:- start:882 stop:1163 length:282 start_codon:yes stop_codon:yes gene_type:complete